MESGQVRVRLQVEPTATSGPCRVQQHVGEDMIQMDPGPSRYALGHDIM